MDEKAIIRSIRQIRQGRGMTLDKLAGLTGLTKGYLSRIENSKKAPPISTLVKISDALGIDITDFFVNEASRAHPAGFPICLTRRGDTLKLGRKESAPGYVYEAIAYSMRGKNMEPYLITVGEKSSPSGFRHQGEEFIYLLEGQLELSYDRKKYLLREGDSVYFDASKLHNGRSVGGRIARFLCIIFSYKRT